MWGAVCASTLGSVWEPDAAPPVQGYDPVPCRMEPRPFFDGWVAVLEALRLGASPERTALALARDLAYGGLTEADSTGVAVLWGLLHYGSPCLAARAAGEPAALVAAMVASPEGALLAAIEDAGAGPGHMAAKVALRLGEPTIGNGAVTEAASLVAATSGMDFAAAVRFAVSRGCRIPEALAAVGAVAGRRSGVPAEWTDPLGEAFVAGWGLRTTSQPATVEELAEWACVAVPETAQTG